MNSAGKAFHVASASGPALPAVPAAEVPDHCASAARIDAHEPATGVFPTLLRSPAQSPITGMDTPSCVVSASFALAEGGCAVGHAGRGPVSLAGLSANGAPAHPITGDPGRFRRRPASRPPSDAAAGPGAAGRVAFPSRPRARGTAER